MKLVNLGNFKQLTLNFRRHVPGTDVENLADDIESNVCVLQQLREIQLRYSFQKKINPECFLSQSEKGKLVLGNDDLKVLPHLFHSYMCEAELSVHSITETKLQAPLQPHIK